MIINALVAGMDVTTLLAIVAGGAALVFGTISSVQAGALRSMVRIETALEKLSKQLQDIDKRVTALETLRDLK